MRMVKFDSDYHHLTCYLTSCPEVKIHTWKSHCVIVVYADHEHEDSCDISGPFDCAAHSIPQVVGLRYMTFNQYVDHWTDCTCQQMNIVR